jgi:hypothetical protein
MQYPPGLGEVNIWEVLCVCVFYQHIFISIPKCISVKFSVRGVYRKDCMINLILSFVEPTLLIHGYTVYHEHNFYRFLINVIVVLMVIVC